MKKLLSIAFAAILLQSCSTQNPNPNNNGNNTTALPSVTICNQVWSQQNLNVSHYRNGDSIPEVRDSLAWTILTTGAWCWYNNDSVNYSQYGKLYNWYAVNDPRGLSPIGWHVPTYSEWKKLIKCVDQNADTATTFPITNNFMSQIAGGKLREMGNIHWLSPNTGATNTTGFTSLPGGQRYSGPVTPTIPSSFGGIRQESNYWSATEIFGNAWSIIINNTDSIPKGNTFKNSGFSVRLIKD